MKCNCTMGQLLFKPGEPVLAMGAHDGYVYFAISSLRHNSPFLDRSVYLLRDDGRDKNSLALTPSHLRLSRRSDNLEIGDIAWGLGSQSDKLFASSMTKGEKGFSGTHRVFDVSTERIAYTLRLEEAGNSIGVHPTGMYVLYHDCTQRS